VLFLGVSLSLFAEHISTREFLQGALLLEERFIPELIDSTPIPATV
jgi:hypothetical protein